MLDILKVSYFHATTTDRPAESPGVLEVLAKDGVNLLAFSATPIGPVHTQYTLFPEDPESFVNIGRKAGLQLNGPHHALLVKGRDQIGAIDAVYRKLEAGHIHVYSSTAISSGEGAFGLVLYMKPFDVDVAVDLLQGEV